MVQKQEYTYNEHDQSQVRAVLKKQKKKKRNKRLRRCSYVLLFSLVMAYFVFDVSKLQNITITGNERLQASDITDNISIAEHASFTIFTSASKIEKEVAKIDDVKSVSVEKTIFGNVTITIEETKLIAFAQKEKIIYTIDEQGAIRSYDASEIDSKIKRLPKVVGMDDEMLQTFAQAYCLVPSQVQAQVSDVVYAPENADPTRCQFNMDDGKILYIRVEYMEKNLQKDNYSQVINRRPECKYFDFAGNNVYCSE